MPTGASRVDALDPSRFISLVESLIEKNIARDGEVLIRSVVSALYFCLFNYWAARKYGVEGKQGKGEYKDQFSYSQFHQELLGKHLDKQIILLYRLRTAADHYTLNPTIITVYNREIIALTGGKLETHISSNALKNALDSSKIILKSLQN